MCGAQTPAKAEQIWDSVIESQPRHVGTSSMLEEGSCLGGTSEILRGASRDTASTPVIFTTPNGCLKIIVVFIISKPLPRRSELFLRKPGLFLSLSLMGHKAIITLRPV